MGKLFVVPSYGGRGNSRVIVGIPKVEVSTGPAGLQDEIAESNKRYCATTRSSSEAEGATGEMNNEVYRTCVKLYMREYWELDRIAELVEYQPEVKPSGYVGLSQGIRHAVRTVMPTYFCHFSSHCE